MSQYKFNITDDFSETHSAAYNVSVSILIAIGGLGAALFVCLVMYTCYVIVVEMSHFTIDACYWLATFLTRRHSGDKPNLAELEEDCSDEDDHRPNT